jgi:hypothetical protein
MRRKALLDKVEQVVRLIRSKGVGVYFVTQNPLDVPEKVLGQLGNRVQHALRAFTPRDQKAVQGGRRNHARQPEVRRRRRPSPSSASARRWSPSSTRRAAPASSSAPSSSARSSAAAGGAESRLTRRPGQTDFFRGIKRRSWR